MNNNTFIIVNTFLHMKQKFLLFLMLSLISLGIYAQSTSPKRVAIYVMGNVSESIQKVVSSKAASRISRSDNYAAVERTDDFLQAMSQEQDYQVSGEVRDDHIVKFGVRFGVRYVAVFDVNQIEDEGFITARLVDVESGHVAKSVDSNRKVKSINDWINLTNNVAYRLVSIRSN